MNNSSITPVAAAPQPVINAVFALEAEYVRRRNAANEAGREAFATFQRKKAEKVSEIVENKKRIAEAIATARQLAEKLEGELALSGETLKAQILQLHAAYEADAHRVARQKEQLALWLAEEKAKIGGKQSNVEQP